MQKKRTSSYEIQLLFGYTAFMHPTKQRRRAKLGHPYIIQQLHQLQFATSDQMHN